MESPPSESAGERAFDTTSLRLALLCFFFSGSTGLVYEVMWTRRLSLTFGHTVLAVSTVLTVFMAGLAAGSLAGGYWSDKQNRGRYYYLKSYGVLETFIGIWALLSLPLLNVVENVYLGFAQKGMTGLPLYLVCFAGAFIVLFPPTMAMGATLPVVSRLLIQEKESLGNLLSKIYGVNTFGAFCGAFAGGFFLLPLLGLKKSVFLGAAVNVLIGIIAIQFARGKSQEAEDIDEADDQSPTSGNIIVPLTFGIAGMTSMVYQLGWTRGLVLSIGSSTYAFSTILAAFLAGLGLGSFAYSRLMKDRNPALKDLATLQLIVAGFGVIVAICLGLLPRFVSNMVQSLGSNYFGLIAGQFVLAFILLLGPTLAMGLMFPLATHLYSSKVSGLGRSLGQVYGANTLGCIVGSFLGGFWLIPVLGSQLTLKLAVLLNLVNALILLWHESPKPRNVRLAVTGLIFLTVFAVPRWDPGLMSAGAGISKTPLHESYDEPAFYADGVSCTVSVGYNQVWQPYLKVNGKTDASVSPTDMISMYLVGYLPGIYHGNPETVAVVGFGAGFTVDAVTDLPSVKRVDCAEIEPSIIEVGGYFAPFNGDVLNDPRVHISITDGRTSVLGSPRKYDMIVNQPSNPWIAGIGNLFTQDFYRECKQRLNPGGVMCQWFQLYSISPDDLKLVMRTFYSEFPHGVVFQNRTDIVFLGSESPMPYPEERIRESMNWDTEFPQKLVELGFPSADFLLGMYLAPREKMLEMVGEEGPVNRDDHPILEFSAPKSMFNDYGPVMDFLRPAVRLLPPNVEPTQEKALSSLIGHTLCHTELPLVEAKQYIVDPDPPLFFYLSALAAIEGRSETAPAAVEAMLEKDGSPRAYLLAAQFYFREKAYEKAQLCYEHLMKTPFPGSIYVATMGAAESARMLQQYERAVPLFAQAAEHTRSSEPLVKQASCLRHMGDDQGALQLLQTALKRYPYDFVAHADIAKLYQDLGQSDKALYHQERAEQLFPGLLSSR
jgi:spermidine synthase